MPATNAAMPITPAPKNAAASPAAASDRARSTRPAPTAGSTADAAGAMGSVDLDAARRVQRGRRSTARSASTASADTQRGTTHSVSLTRPTHGSPVFAQIGGQVAPLEIVDPRRRHRHAARLRRHAVRAHPYLSSGDASRAAMAFEQGAFSDRARGRRETVGHGTRRTSDGLPDRASSTGPTRASDAEFYAPAAPGHPHRRRRDRGRRRPVRRARHHRDRPRPHGLVGLALRRGAGAPDRARHERGRARGQLRRPRHTVVHDLNADPRAAVRRTSSFEAAVCCVSVDYLIRPVEVFADVARTLRPGAPFVCTFSNRCFPTKAIRGWLASTDEQHCEIVARYFQLAGGFDGPTIERRTPPAHRGDPLSRCGRAARTHGQRQRQRPADGRRHRFRRRRGRRSRSARDPRPWRGTWPGRRGAAAARPTRRGNRSRSRCSPRAGTA